MRKLLLAVASVVTIAASSIAAAEPDGGPRLRIQDTRIARVVKEGLLRSETFRALVDRIEAGDVIVYIGISPQLKSTLSGRLTWMTSAGGFRYVRASISTDLTFNQMIATVAHELQHAVEVIEDESVKDEPSLVALYKRIGEPSSATNSAWETTTALEIGYQVRRELVAMPSAAMARLSGNNRS